MKKLILSITIALSLLSFNLQAQSYVNDWPVQSLLPSTKTMEQLNKPNDIPYYLQNHTFRDTIYDTLSWEDLSDIDYTFIKALGEGRSFYSLDIEILDDGGFLIPWYNSTGFYITRTDSLGEEIYTNHYSNIHNAFVDCYRDGRYVYMAGRINMDTADYHQNHIALIKYDLKANDTAFLRIVAACEYQVHGSHVSYLKDDTVFYVVASISSFSKYIFKFNNQGVIKRKIPKGGNRLYGLFELNDTLHSIDDYTQIFSVTDSLSLLTKLHKNYILSFSLANNIYI
jgi:hypothetical protein